MKRRAFLAAIPIAAAAARLAPTDGSATFTTTSGIEGVIRSWPVMVEEGMFFAKRPGSPTVEYFPASEPLPWSDR